MHTKSIRFGAFMVLCLLLTACGNGDSDRKVKEAVSVNQRNITGLELSANNSIIETDMSQFYTATGIVDNGDGDPLDVTDEVRWSTSDSSVASINQAGILTGHSDGMVEVRIELADLIATSELQVSSAPLDSIAITENPTPVSVCTSGQQLKAEGDYDDGQSPRNITDFVTWASDDVNLASITQDGVLSTFGDGTVTISATRASPDGTGDVTGTAVITIDNNIQSLSLDVGNGSVAIGDDLQVTATGTYPGGATADVTSTSTWSSSNSTVFTVSDESGEKGLLIAQDEGTANVEAECNVTNPIRATEPVTVNEAVVINGITVNRGSESLEFDLNDSPVQLTAHLLNSDGSLNREVTEDDDTIWSFDSNTSGEEAEISNEEGSKGELTFSAEGINIFRVRYEDEDSGLGPFSLDFEVEIKE